LPLVTDSDLMRLSVRLGQLLLTANARMATAESCTGGWIARCITDVPGSSQWFESGYVVYSNEAKQRDLGVEAAMIEHEGSVSEPVVRAMARGALERAGVDLAIAVSGIAGPSGAVMGKPVGTVWFAVAHRRGKAVEEIARLKLFKGDRELVRRKSVQFGLKLLLEVPFIQ
jgi:nicotinamide-nucleotide amidase